MALSFENHMAEVIESVICTGCGCLCDDLDVTLEGNQIIEVANVCLWGVNRFIASKKFHSKKDRRRILSPQLRRKGRAMAVSYESALEEAANILVQARRPLIYGLTNNGSWAQEAALKLACRWQARLEPADLPFMAPYFEALSNHGLYWTPLEEIRDEADTILFWGGNPIHSCPRHVVRYSVFSRGRFIERGREERQGVQGVFLRRGGCKVSRRSYEKGNRMEGQCPDTQDTCRKPRAPEDSKRTHICNRDA